MTDNFATISQNKLKAKFKKELQNLVGEDCWGFAAGSGTGSVIYLNIGKKISLIKPIDNPNLTEIVRNNESEFGLFVECVWRVDSKSKVVCGCWDDNSIGREMLEGLKNLLNRKITNITIFEPSFDLVISFSGNLPLKIFCDQVNVKDCNNNYSFFIPEIVYTVGNKSILKIEKRDK